MTGRKFVLFGYFVGGLAGGMTHGLLQSLTVYGVVASAVIGAVCLPLAEFTSSLPKSRLLQGGTFGGVLGVTVAPLGFVAFSPEAAFVRFAVPIALTCVISGALWKFFEFRWGPWVGTRKASSS
ncbi:hypothetical protein ACFL59_10795 [Planctomycetota bacterium]